MTLNFDLLTPKVDRFMRLSVAPWTTYASLHQYRFILFLNILSTIKFGNG